MSQQALENAFVDAPLGLPGRVGLAQVLDRQIDRLSPACDPGLADGRLPGLAEGVDLPALRTVLEDVLFGSRKLPDRLQQACGKGYPPLRLERLGRPAFLDLNSMAPTAASKQS